MEKILYLKGEEIQGLISDQIMTIFLKGGAKCVVTTDFIGEDKISGLIKKIVNHEDILLIYDSEESSFTKTSNLVDKLLEGEAKFNDAVYSGYNTPIKPKTFY